MVTSIDFKHLLIALDLSKNIIHDDLQYEIKSNNDENINVELLQNFLLFLENLTFEYINTKNKQSYLYVIYTNEGKTKSSLTTTTVLTLLYNIQEIANQFVIDFFQSTTIKHDFFPLYKDLKEFIRLLSVVIIKITMLLKRTTIYN